LQATENLPLIGILSFLFCELSPQQAAALARLQAHAPGRVEERRGICQRQIKGHGRFSFWFFFFVRTKKKNNMNWLIEFIIVQERSI
jgi:hypothetical protein